MISSTSTSLTGIQEVVADRENNNPEENHVQPRRTMPKNGESCQEQQGQDLSNTKIEQDSIVVNSHLIGNIGTMVAGVFDSGAGEENEDSRRTRRHTSWIDVDFQSFLSRSSPGPTRHEEDNDNNNDEGMFDLGLDLTLDCDSLHLARRRVVTSCKIRRRHRGEDGDATTINANTTTISLVSTRERQQVGLIDDDDDNISVCSFFTVDETLSRGNEDNYFYYDQEEEEEEGILDFEVPLKG